MKTRSPSRSTMADRLSALAEGHDPAQGEQLDLCLIFVSKRAVQVRLTPRGPLEQVQAGQELLTVGGRWDPAAGTYTDAPDLDAHVIQVNPNQVGVVLKFRAWLEAYLEDRPRELLLLTGGNRRGGKSFITVACLVALAIAVPGVNLWMVTPSIEKREELEGYVRRQTLPSWRSYKGEPSYRFVLANGSTIRAQTGATMSALRRGKADGLLYNEPQDMSREAFTTGLAAVVDTGGLLLFAGNPARRKRGDWYNKLRDRVLEGRYKNPDGSAFASFFDVPAEGNLDINQETRSQVATVMRDIDERAHAADMDGLWLPVGDFCYAEYFSDRPDADGKIRNLGPAPRLGDITTELTKRKSYQAFPMLGGVDFQGRPWNAGVILKAYGELERPIYYAVDEILKEGWEDEFLDEVFFRHYQPEQLIWVGDSSGTWQDAHHSRGRVSFDVFKQRRWRIEAPQKKKSDRGEFPRNPDVADRVNLVNRLLAQGRLVVDPERCPRLVESLRECEVSPSNGKPRGKHAHLTDALGYALWWAEPLPAPHREPLTKGDVLMTRVGRRGLKLL